MKKLRKNLFLGIVIITASVTGYFLQEREQSSYILEMESSAGETPPAAVPAVTETNTDNPPAENEQPNQTDSDNAQGNKININTASKETLKTLSGIGDVKAERIIKYRNERGNFEVIEDIMKIEGIGRKTFEKIKDFITVK